ncbi:MAG: thiolase family protein [Candidatus Microthrix sp.]|nr:thiolase family protein [Candidatus Microthrix sp.]MBP6150875.1 thiolase family protein [Candidatus Microthrix sp.]MBP7877578.1 thiolase family protein [Candidatus Microthrix sp.]MBP7986619.1 thiolase family protein [Candidatus Microthrix sp.]MBP7994095.1 thiolase family protein [Candidatus Microthrix sp.]
MIASAVRTPIGTSYKGTLAATTAQQLSEVAVGAALERSGVPAEAIEDLVMGESMQGGGNIARYTAIELGLDSVPGAAIQRWCASGMSAVNYLAANIASGMVECGIAGGTESMSTAPATMKPGPDGSQQSWLPAAHPETDITPAFNMAMTVGENTARIAGVTREQADEWAFHSHQRAIAAIDNGYFDAELVPVPLGDGNNFSVDEHPRRTSSLEKLASLPVINPMLEGAIVTPGNSSGLNDGAAAMVLCSRKFASSHGLTPLATIRSWASAADMVERNGLAPTLAIPKALKLAGIGIDDVDAVEINEAFSSMAVASSRELGLDHAITNQVGSGCSLGHPIACTGARMLVTMAHQLARTDTQWGVAAMCAAGGMGAATVIERL